jgi:hypothetical protein
MSGSPCPPKRAPKEEEMGTKKVDPLVDAQQEHRQAEIHVSDVRCYYDRAVTHLKLLPAGRAKSEYGRTVQGLAGRLKKARESLGRSARRVRTAHLMAENIERAKEMSRVQDKRWTMIDQWKLTTVDGPPYVKWKHDCGFKLVTDSYQPPPVTQCPECFAKIDANIRAEIAKWKNDPNMVLVNGDLQLGEPRHEFVGNSTAYANVAEVTKTELYVSTPRTAPNAIYDDWAKCQDRSWEDRIFGWSRERDIPLPEGHTIRVLNAKVVKHNGPVTKEIHDLRGAYSDLGKLNLALTEHALPTFRDKTLWRPGIEHGRWVANRASSTCYLTVTVTPQDIAREARNTIRKLTLHQPVNGTIHRLTVDVPNAFEPDSPARETYLQVGNFTGHEDLNYWLGQYGLPALSDRGWKVDGITMTLRHRRRNAVVEIQQGCTDINMMDPSMFPLATKKGKLFGENPPPVYPTQTIQNETVPRRQPVNEFLEDVRDMFAPHGEPYDVLEESARRNHKTFHEVINELYTHCLFQGLAGAMALPKLRKRAAEMREHPNYKDCRVLGIRNDRVCTGMDGPHSSILGGPVYGLTT